MRLRWKWPYSFYLVLLGHLLWGGNQLLCKKSDHSKTTLLLRPCVATLVSQQCSISCQPCDEPSWTSSPVETLDNCSPSRYQLYEKYQMRTTQLSLWIPVPGITYMVIFVTRSGCKSYKWGYSVNCIRQTWKSKWTSLVLANCPNNLGVFFSFQIQIVTLLQTSNKTEGNDPLSLKQFSNILFFQKSYWLQRIFSKHIDLICKGNIFSYFYFILFLY